MLEPLANTFLGLLLGQPFEAGEVDRLLPDLHLWVETSLLGEIADMAKVALLDGLALEEYLSTIRGCDAVDDTDERAFPCSVRS